MTDKPATQSHDSDRIGKLEKEVGELRTKLSHLKEGQHADQHGVGDRPAAKTGHPHS